MTRQRDNQRQRLYDAEEKACAAIGMSKWIGQTIPNADLQSFVDGILRNRAVAARWPGKKIRVELTKGGGHASYYGDSIHLGVAARNEFLIMHEVAHCLVSVSQHDIAAHGPEFAGVLVWLVQTIHSKELADALRQAFKEGGVRKSNALIPSPIDRTEKALRDRLDSLRKQQRDLNRAVLLASEELREHRRKKGES